MYLIATHVKPRKRERAAVINAEVTAFIAAFGHQQVWFALEIEFGEAVPIRSRLVQNLFLIIKEFKVYAGHGLGG